MTVANVTVWHSFEMVANGRRAKGSYAHDRHSETVRVRSSLGSEKASQLAGACPDHVARQLLLELVKEGEA